MNHASNPVNIAWAERNARRIARRCPWLVEDAISAAYVGLTMASNRPDPPVDVANFQRVASRWVFGMVREELRKNLSKHRLKHNVSLQALGDIPCPDNPESLEWIEWRDYLAKNLTSDQADVFLSMFGITDCTTQCNLQEQTRLSKPTIRGRYKAALKRIREVYDAQDAA